MATVRSPVTDIQRDASLYEKIGGYVYMAAMIDSRFDMILDAAGSRFVPADGVCAACGARPKSERSFSEKISRVLQLIADEGVADEYRATRSTLWAVKDIRNWCAHRLIGEHGTGGVVFFERDHHTSGAKYTAEQFLEELARAGRAFNELLRFFEFYCERHPLHEPLFPVQRPSPGAVPPAIARFTISNTRQYGSVSLDIQN